MSCWIVPRDIAAGKTWINSIMDGINETDVFILVHTQNSRESKNVHREITEADNNRGQIIIPIRFEN